MVLYQSRYGGILVSIGIGNLGIPIPISPIFIIIIIIINNRLAKLDMQQAGNSVKVYFSIKFALIALINIEILVVYTCMKKIDIL